MLCDRCGCVGGDVGEGVCGEEDVTLSGSIKDVG